MGEGMNPIARKPALLGLLAAAALSLCAGCSAVTQTGLAAPTVAFAASESDLAQACSIEGTPTVVAAHVMPMAGVTAEAEGGRVWLRFATKGDPRAALAVTPSTLDVEEVEGAAPEETRAAKQVPAGPVAVALEGGRHLVAWTDGSAYSGMRVRAITTAENGAPVGAPIDLGFQGSAVGRPAVAVTASGKGVLAFEESNGGGFHLVVASVSCTPPVAR
jgi:hypothetical protein